MMTQAASEIFKVPQLFPTMAKLVPVVSVTPEKITLLPEVELFEQLTDRVALVCPVLVVGKARVGGEQVSVG